MSPSLFLSPVRIHFRCSLYVPAAGRCLKADFFCCRASKHSNLRWEVFESPSRPDSRRSLHYYHSWLRLNPQRQAEPREAKCSASARPFWFGLGVPPRRTQSVYSRGVVLDDAARVAHFKVSEVGPKALRSPG